MINTKIRKNILIVLFLSVCMVTCFLMSVKFVNAEDTNLFPNGDCELPVEELEWGEGVELENSEEKYEGEQAYLLKSGTTNYTIDSLNNVLNDNLEFGSFYEYSFYMKNKTLDNETGAVLRSATAFSTLTINGLNGSGSTDVYLGIDSDKSYFHIPNNEYILFSHTLAFYQPENENVQIYVDNRPVQESILSGIESMYIKLGIKDKDLVLIDNIKFKKITVFKNIVLNLSDAGNDLTDALFTFENDAGEPVDLKVVYENGSYILMDVPFENVSQTYNFTIAGYDNFEGEIGYNDTEKNYAVNNFNANIFVKDEQGEVIKDAIVSGVLNSEEIFATNNGDGSYTFSDLSEAFKVCISKKYFVTAFLDIDTKIFEYEIVLKEPKKALPLNSNFIPNGNFEQEDNPWIGSSEIINSIMKDGDFALYSSLPAGSLLNYDVDLSRMDILSGVTYRFEMQAYGLTENSKIAFSPMFTGESSGTTKWFPGGAGNGGEALVKNDWKTIVLDFYIKYDPETRTAVYQIDDMQAVTMDSIDSMQAFSIRIYAVTASEFIIDNVSMSPYYNAEIAVQNRNAVAVENVEFTVYDWYGKKIEIKPVYDSEKKVYCFENIYGEFSIQAKAGPVIYAIKQINYMNNFLTLVPSYNSQITLLAEDGTPITSASITTTTGEIFMDMGDGTYILNEIISPIDLIIVIDGEIYECNNLIDFESANQVFNIKKDVVNDNQSGNQDQQNGKGCSGNVFANGLIFSLTCLTLISLVIAIKKKNNTEEWL